MHSRDRLLRTLRRQPVDRVPISTYELVGYNPDSFENQQPTYRKLMDRIREDTDCIYMWSWDPFVDSGLWDTRTETAPDGAKTTYWRLRTPKGDLTKTTRELPGIHTVWTTEHLLKSVEDIDAYLTVLPQLHTIGDANLREAARTYALASERVADNGMVMSSGGDPSYPVAELFEFGLFTMLCFQYKEKILELVDAFTNPILDVYRAEAEHHWGDMHRLCGPEYYTPPYLPPDYFRDFVVPGATRAAEILHKAGIFLRLHSHGRIRQVLPLIVEIGADATDPCEPPPDGDIALDELKRDWGYKLILFGGTELKLLEHGEPEEIREHVRGLMAAGKPGGGYVIMPTASPIDDTLSPKTERNYMAWLDAALEFGAY